MLERYTERDLKKKQKPVEYTTTTVGWFYDPPPLSPAVSVICAPLSFNRIEVAGLLR